MSHIESGTLCVFVCWHNKWTIHRTMLSASRFVSSPTICIFKKYPVNWCFSFSWNPRWWIAFSAIKTTSKHYSQSRSFLQVCNSVSPVLDTEFRSIKIIHLSYTCCVIMCSLGRTPKCSCVGENDGNDDGPGRYVVPWVEIFLHFAIFGQCDLLENEFCRITAEYVRAYVLTCLFLRRRWKTSSVNKFINLCAQFLTSKYFECWREGRKSNKNHFIHRSLSAVTSWALNITASAARNTSCVNVMLFCRSDPEIFAGDAPCNVVLFALRRRLVGRHGHWPFPSRPSVYTCGAK